MISISFNKLIASSDSSNRSIDYDDIDDTYPNALDFKRNSYFYNKNHIYDYLKQNQLICLNKEKAFYILLNMKKRKMKIL